MWGLCMQEAFGLVVFQTFSQLSAYYRADVARIQISLYWRLVLLCG
jgi:hypothetical protein